MRLQPWESWSLSLMMLLALFARDGRYQPITTLAMLLLLCVVLTRLERISALVLGPLLLYVLWAAASVSWSAFASDSIRQVLNLVMWTLVGLALASTQSMAEVCRVWARAGRVAIVFATISGLQLAAAGSDVATGIFNSKNHLGYAAAASLIPIIAVDWKRSRWRVGAWFVLALTASVSANSQTSVTLVLMIPLLYAATRLLSTSKGSSLTGVGLTVFAGAAALLLATFQVVLEQSTGLLGRDSTLSGRDEIWAAVRETIQDRPLSGTGIGGIWTRPNEDPTLSLLVQLPAYLRPATVYAHNGFLDAGLQLGLVGLGLLVLISFKALISSVRRTAKSRDLTEAMPLVVVITYIVANMTETRLYNDQAWVALVIVVATPIARRKVKRPTARPKVGRSDQMAAL